MPLLLRVRAAFARLGYSAAQITPRATASSTPLSQEVPTAPRLSSDDSSTASPAAASCDLSCRRNPSTSRKLGRESESASQNERSDRCPSDRASSQPLYAAAAARKSERIDPNAFRLASALSSCFSRDEATTEREAERTAATVRMGGKQPQRHASTSILPSLGSRGSEASVCPSGVRENVWPCVASSAWSATRFCREEAIDFAGGGCSARERNAPGDEAPRRLAYAPCRVRVGRTTKKTQPPHTHTLP
mmetsp:Transcript_51191/g.90402  ORF Transcript_51191/g.90402 Transcript_51191/m.90402 type:complete len:248 (-) Transcript_51191:229-972(-)